MKIGLYGDSFTESHHQAKPFAWYNLLAKKLGGVIYNFDKHEEGISYGKGASSTFWSYKNFLRHHEKHELNIFIASDPMKFPQLVPIFGPDAGAVPISGMRSLEWYKHDPMVTDEGREMLKHLESWTLISDEEFMTTVHELVLQDMERRSKGRLIILPADLTYGSAFTPDRVQHSGIKIAMWDVARVAYRSLGHPGIASVQQERHHTIAAHLTEEVSEMFADMLYKYIVHGEEITHLPNHLPHRYSLNYYFDV
jgi:hypothetical protein